MIQRLYLKYAIGLAEHQPLQIRPGDTDFVLPQKGTFGFVSPCRRTGTRASSVQRFNLFPNRVFPFLARATHQWASSRFGIIQCFLIEVLSPQLYFAASTLRASNAFAAVIVPFAATSHSAVWNC